MDFTWVTSDDANAIQNAIVDAKGDLIAASAADTPARLAVGNNGETLVADSSTSTGLRYQSGVNNNAVINGGFDVWQRGTSFTGSLGNVYGADRWLMNVSTARTYSRQTASLDGIQYSLRMQRNNGSTDTGTPLAVYSMESADSYRFAGKTVTLSFWAKAGANFSAASSALGIQWYTGTGTDQNVYTAGYTGSTTVANTTRTITTSWARHSVTVTFASNVTETGFWFSYTPTGTAGANDWVEITGVQMELGSVPTEFKRAGNTLAGELAACQRYYFRQGGQTLYQRLANGAFNSTTNAFIQFPHPVTMRIAPTSVDYSTMALNDYTSTIAITSIAIDFAGSSMTSLTCAVASGGTAYRPAQLLTNNSTSAYVGLSAEL
jgi:hypothetical protein